jgi:hypothetical protein
MADYFRENRSKFPGGSVTNYRVLGKDNPDTDQTPYASLSVHHEYATHLPTFTNDSIGSLEDEDGSSGLHPTYLDSKFDELFNSSYGSKTVGQRDALAALQILRGYPQTHGRNSRHEDPKAWAVGQTQTNPAIAPDKLFFEHTPAKTQVASMFVDPSMKAHGINLLGIAYDDHNKAPFEADHSLTRFSSRLTNNAIERGLPVTTHPDNPNAVSTSNDEDDPVHNKQYMGTEWANRIRSNTAPFIHASPISDLSKIRGKEAVREMLGKTRNTKPVTSKGLSDQFLPGMEGFV